MKIVLTVVFALVSFAVGIFVGFNIPQTSEESAVIPKVTFNSLEKYTIDNLSKENNLTANFTTKDMLKEDKEYNSYLFELEFNPSLENKVNKKVTGQINLPNLSGKFPLIIMLRGYVDQKAFKTGDGTRNASNFFSKNGFITVAPDFLGYGGSDSESADIFETRFQTYVTVLSLIKSLPQIDKWDKNNLFIWGHSNGGQIALTTLEITGKDYPTTLWAPVSKPFPYSVLYYTDQSEDRGKLIRNALSDFEKNHNVDLYSLDLYLDRINTKVQIHQGAVDDAVPYAWNTELFSKLKKLDKDVVFYGYPSTDHNMRPSWDLIVQRDLEFFKNNIK